MLALAFVKLVTERPMGFSGQGPIPVGAIWDWCDRQGLDRASAEHVEAVIRVVDATMLARDAAAAKAAKAPDPDHTRG